MLKDSVCFEIVNKNFFTLFKVIFPINKVVYILKHKDKACIVYFKQG